MRLCLLVSIGFLGALSAAEVSIPGDNAGEESFESRLSYAVAYSQIAPNFRRMIDDMKLDQEQIMAGLADGLNGAESRLPEADMQAVIEQFQQKMMAEQQAQQAEQQADSTEAGAANSAAGDAHIAALVDKEGVVITESGLAYEVLEKGESETHPGPTARVKVHYRGTLLDGTEFDSSYSRGEPIEFPLNGVIAGWTEGVQLMSPGDKFRFHIPGDLAYGKRGSPPNIGPDETLIFEVELLEIVD